MTTIELHTSGMQHITFPKKCDTTDIDIELLISILNSDTVILKG
jgi:hypothetical protein